MECGRLSSGLRWSAYFSQSETNLASNLVSAISEESLDDCNDNYLITFPDDDSDDSTYEEKDLGSTFDGNERFDSAYNTKKRCRPTSLYDRKDLCNSTYDGQGRCVSVNDGLDQLQDDDSEISFGLNRCYENPLFIPPEIENISDRPNELSLTKLSQSLKLGCYKFCRSSAVNDFDIELEEEEAMPVVYLSTSKAAKLERSLRIGCYKKVRYYY